MYWYIHSMNLAKDKVAELCRQKGISLSALLKNAGVSRNAYYSLTRRDSILPKSIIAITDELGVPPGKILEEGATRDKLACQLADNVAMVMREHPDSDPDNVRHTLLLLQEQPLDRLRRALTRGQGAAAYRQRNQVS
jgi:hypothetical protein